MVADLDIYPTSLFPKLTPREFVIAPRGHGGAAGDDPRVLVPAADLDVEPIRRPGRRLEVQLEEERDDT